MPLFSPRLIAYLPFWLNKLNWLRTPRAQLRSHPVQFEFLFQREVSPGLPHLLGLPANFR
jgi:hypothetical protein